MKKNIKPSNKTIKLKQDLFGADGWNTVEDIFYALNNCIKYVVLRDFENDMSELYHLETYDADILCDNKEECSWILNAKKEIINGDSQYVTKINNRRGLFDLKSVTSGYYGISMANDIINKRVLNKFYYIPNPEYHYMSCLYHALIHKFNYETEYNIRLESIFGKKIHDSTKEKDFYIKKCSDWLMKHKYSIAIYEENIKKFNKENIEKFDHDLFENGIFTIYSLYLDNEELLSKNETLQKELQTSNQKYEMVINSKGWKLLEKIRKVVYKIKK